MARRVGKGFVALITGGAQGLGAATARRLAAHGASVCVADIKRDGIEQVAAEIGEDCLSVPCDVTDPASMEAAFDACISRFGSVHSAVQCAGIHSYMLTLDEDGSSIDMDRFDKVMKVNTYGALHMAKFAAVAIARNEPDERKQRGSIHFTSSICATEGLSQSIAYSASKAALNGMVVPMARDLGHCGIRVNAIAPGTIPTAMQYDGIRTGYGASIAKLHDHTGHEVLSLEPSPEEVKAFQDAFIDRYYPPGCAEQGTEDDFAHFVHSCIDNPFLNGAVLRLDGAMRM